MPAASAKLKPPTEAHQMRFTQTELKMLIAAVNMVAAGDWDEGSYGERPDFEALAEKIVSGIKPPRLSETQTNALRLAAEVPSCLGSGFYRPTTDLLLRLGLIESYGSRTIAEGEMTTTYGITDDGREALAANRK
jgi:hypothetical protein